MTPNEAFFFGYDEPTGGEQLTSKKIKESERNQSGYPSNNCSFVYSRFLWNGY